MPPTDHSAAASLAGYIWQIVLAVCGLIQQGDGCVEIEGRDDVVIVDQGQIRRTALQAKHHFPATELSLWGPDLWKTLHVWIDAELARPGAFSEFVLSTTAGVGELALYVAADGRLRAVPDLIVALNRIAQDGRNSKLATAYKAWKDFTGTRRDALLAKVRILHGQKTISDAKSQIDATIRKTWTDKRAIPEVRERILGFVLTEVCVQLENPPVTIEYDHVRDRAMEGIAAALPNSVFPDLPITPPALEAETSRDPRYLQQLRLLRAKRRAAIRAINALHFAKIHRDEWLQSRLTSSASLRRLDTGLRRYWAVLFEKAERDLKSGVHPDEEGAGWAVHDGCMEHQEPLDGRFHGTELVNGSFYLLTNDSGDDDPVGWHPNFVSLLRGGKNDGE